MIGKASCKDCCLCVPGEDTYAKKDWEFPLDMECLMDCFEFPDAGHICKGFVHKEKTNKIQQRGM